MRNEKYRIECYGKGSHFLHVGGNQSAQRKPTKAGMESANQIHVQLLASCIGERPSVRAPNQLSLPQGYCES